MIIDEMFVKPYPNSLAHSEIVAAIRWYVAHVEGLDRTHFLDRYWLETEHDERMAAIIKQVVER